jgi:phage shock protein A
VQAFRTRKETIKATYTAAEAQTRINEAFSGISEDMGDVGLAIQRAEDKTAQMQARAGAIDELLASGALEDHVGGGNDYIQAELDKLGATAGVDDQLAAMKREIASNAPRQIEANGDGDGAESTSADVPAAQPQAGDGA